MLRHPPTGIPQYDEAVASPITRHLISARVDMQLNNNNRLFFRTNPYKELRIAEGVGGKVTYSAGDNYHAYNQDGVVGEFAIAVLTLAMVVAAARSFLF
jgi:hypothetical protein